MLDFSGGFQEIFIEFELKNVQVIKKFINLQ